MVPACELQPIPCMGFACTATQAAILCTRHDAVLDWILGSSDIRIWVMHSCLSTLLIVGVTSVTHDHSALLTFPAGRRLPPLSR